ncbi:hypothetical protein N7456_007344 [Penicillium angulare]|uniref:Aminoglycoside phosphotransferase domain-containing protein n=1 Tax=Penicillium angulare TaxID=116970 RepID=A0A9W9FAI0_9EURO|nr:hypothetical protein N7456_007344 [Penicillium angulare]
MDPRMRYDDAARETSDALADWWASYILKDETSHQIAEFLLKHHKYVDCPGDPLPVFDTLSTGAFNTALQMKFARSPGVIIRFPLPGAIMFPEEKLRNEVAIMRLIRDQTTIPVPFVIHSGTKRESPAGLGPFIIMDTIEHTMDMVDKLKTPGRPNGERNILDPNISIAELQTMYKSLARILISLSKLSYNSIGSLRQIDDFTWHVADRPLSLHLNELVRLGTLPCSKLPLPGTTFETASSYFDTLAELHISHLISQRNDSIESTDDCRRKFIARLLFRRIVQDETLRAQWVTHENGPFPLWCDDFRPGNVLVDNDVNITGVVDWEFSYTAPVEFSHAPPWWLLLEKPEYWPQGLDDWCIEYEKRLDVFLVAMMECESEKEGERLGKSQTLADAMRKSWASGDFWIMYAARNNFAFDAIYWSKIDKRFFGETDSEDLGDVWKSRVHLLRPDEQEFIERQVVLKMEAMETRELAWDADGLTLDAMELMMSTKGSS